MTWYDDNKIRTLEWQREYRKINHGSILENRISKRGTILKFIFFLIPVLVIGIIPIIHAEKGLNYDDVIIGSYPNGTEIHVWKSAPERIIVNDQYIDFRFINGANFLSVETGHGSVKLNKNTCSFDFYKKGIIRGDPLFSDSIVAKIANNGTETWNELTQITNAVCEASGNENQLVAKKFVAGVGLMEYKYINTGKTWKTQLEATNLSLLTNIKFGFTQTIDLNRDTINYGGSEKNLDNYANITFDRIWLENNKGKIINFLNDISFDFDLGFDNLKSIAIYDTGTAKSKLSFNYLYNSKILLPNKIIIIDPTFGYTTATAKTILTTTTTGAACGTGTSNQAWSFNLYFPNSGTNTACYGSVPRWDITSIPDPSTITNVNIRFDVGGVINMGAYSCEWKAMQFDPNTASDFTLWADLRNGTTFATDTQCRTVSNNYVIDMGASADTNVKNSLAGNWWSSGVSLTGSRAGTDTQTENLTGGGTVELEITYTTTRPPYAVTDLINPSITTTTVSLDWTAPYAGGGGQTIIGYQINKTTPWSIPNTILVNNTGTNTTDYVVTGQTPGTKYSFRVTALTNVTNGHPLNNATGNILNVTTPLNIFSSVAPTNLKVYPVICNPALLNLQWSSGAMQNINGYKIQRETPVGGGFVTLGTGNTSNTLTYYNDTGRVINNNYNYKVFSLNGSGISNESNQYAHYTCKKPNAVTVLTGSATNLSTIMLTWTAPVPYAPLLGYQVNYTIPFGKPLTIFSPPHTGSAATTATVLGLQIGGNYSFQVSPVTIFGTNATGKIFNSTTTTAFSLGNLTLSDTTNIDDFKIFYERTNTNATSILLKVTYPQSYTLTCNMLFKFSGNNNTHTGLVEIPITGPGADINNVVSSFIFNGANTEIITVNCYDKSIPDSSKYIVTITQFELLKQIANFRNGTYGTMGQIGGLDLITLIVVIIGMIGFNRVTPIAGVIFTVITVGALSVFGIIEMYQIMFPALALIVLLAYTRTRQSE